MKTIRTILVLLITLPSAALFFSCATYKGDLQVKLDSPEKTYISPKNQDGIQDELKVPVNVPAAYKDMAISGYRFVVSGRQNNPVRTIQQGQEPPVKGTSGQKVKVDIPKSLIWDGKSDDGQYVADGDYTYVIEAWDSLGNRGKTLPLIVVVDNTPPSLAVSSDSDTFSPNGDGRKDALTIKQADSSQEDLWEGEIRDSSKKTVKAFTWEGKAQDFAWDGKDASGRQLSDGPYSYSVSSTDRAGNSALYELKPIVIDTQTRAVSLDIEYPVFSPDGDGMRDTLRFSSRLEIADGVESWSFAITDEGGRTGRSIQGSGKVPEQYEFDGKDDTGKALPYGTYRGTLNVVYSNGDAPQADSPAFVLDARPTPVSVGAEYPSFSPNGDGKKDMNRLIPKLGIAQGVESWSLVIQDGKGTGRRTFTGTGGVRDSIEFDGKDERGVLLPDGAYRAVLNVVYEKGNRPQAASPEFSIDTLAPRITLTSSSLLFSPDVISGKNSVTITQSSSIEELWEGAILNTAGKAVKGYTWKGAAASFEWDGRDGAAVKVPDGTYGYRVASTDPAGNTTVAELKGIQVDSRATLVSVAAASKSFSPNGDGFKDSMAFNLSAGLRDGIKSWNLTVKNAGGQGWRVFSGRATLPEQVTWDGKGDGGRIADGAYTAELSVEYEKGNLATARTESVLLDISPPQAIVEIVPKLFSPDNDGVDDTVTIWFKVKDESPLVDWSARIQDPAGNPFIDFSGKGAPPQSIGWNGLSSSGELVQSADDYPVVFKVTDDLGNTATVKQDIGVDVLVIREGDRLKIVISSIYFKPYTADFVGIPSDRAERNLKTLSRLAEILKKHGTYKIQLEGHAVSEYWSRPQRARQEETEELLPLSKARAEVIKKSLVDRGIAADRMTTVGYGGSRPVVPHRDRANHWKNRRVEFILLK